VQQGGAFIFSGNAASAVTDVAALIGTDALSEDGELILRAGKKRFCRALAT
jgi:tyrosyl-tRNA synthetase